MVVYYRYPGGIGQSGVYACADPDAGDLNLPADLYHLSHCPDGWPGVPSEPSEEAPTACP